MLESLQSQQRLFVKQIFELAELVGFETRNKYRISDENGNELAFAAEQQKGIFGFLFRQFLGHWRPFEIHFFSSTRQKLMTAKHPFRWFFQRLELFDAGGRFVGVVERRFSILSKKFDVQDHHGRTLFQVSSPIWRIWTFPFRRNGKEVARIAKKWSGIGYELFSDRDNFMVEYFEPTLTNDERALILASALYVDLIFFEQKE